MVRVLWHFNKEKKQLYHALNILKFISNANSMYKRNYSVRMDIMYILYMYIFVNNIKIYTTDQYNVLRLLKNYKL